jgi:hypothetical protein
VVGGLDAVETLAPQGNDPGQGYWTWTSLPAGASVDCSPNGEPDVDDPATPTQCEVVSGGPPQHPYPNLRVTVDANGLTYEREYSWTE